MSYFYFLFFSILFYSLPPLTPSHPVRSCPVNISFYCIPSPSLSLSIVCSVLCSLFLFYSASCLASPRFASLLASHSPTTGQNVQPFA
ncbi:hypothetical protein BKA65DRAFT_512213 [Rhexocercosporidium sp. MPI-PUGE-AT-0058]|nr:hypothetical protein BKA65DRAFT_512213 [Rhexocercosporidium sp. MPI-PUGE-AT-0058]